MAKLARLILALALFVCWVQPALADYSWTDPTNGEVCGGGDTTQSTIGVWLQASHPIFWNHLSNDAQNILNHVYRGTTCSQYIDLAVQLGPNYQPNGAIVIGNGEGTPYSPGENCPPVNGVTPGSPTYPGCFLSRVTLQNTYNAGWFIYSVSNTLEGNTYWSTISNVSWTAIASSFRDSHGFVLGGMTITYLPPATGSDGHIAYDTVASGIGTYQWFTGADIATDATNFVSETVHIGFQANFAWTNQGQNNNNIFCYFGEFQAFNVAPLISGPCANP